MSWMVGNDPNPNDALVMYTIYRKPLDFPDDFVVRKIFAYKGNPTPVPGPILGVVKTYEEALSKIPPGLNSLGRDPGDHPSVVETWI
jgi:hypothetical protein